MPGSFTTIINYNNASNFTFDLSKVEFNASAKLKDLETPTDFTETFAADTLWTYNASLLEFAGGKVLLKNLETATNATYPFSTDAAWTYNAAKIEFTGGKAQLLDLETATDATYPFTNDTAWTYNGAEIEFVAGKAQLKLVNTQEIFTENYTNDTGFTYDNTRAEFTAGKVQQKTRPDIICGAFYSSTINLTWGGGSLTGSATGGAAISGNKLDLTHGDIRYVDYSATSNADSQQVGAMRCNYTPNYSGSPASNQYAFAVTQAAGDATNAISLYHTSTGQIHLTIIDSSDVDIMNLDVGAWSPTSGVQYELELNWDITTGATRAFIDGVQIGSTQTGTGTRDSNIGLLRIGTNIGGTRTSNFEISDFFYFPAVQHTANYTPGSTETQYVETKVDLPTHVEPFAQVSYDAFASTESGTPKYILDDKYWNGAAVVASDGSYAQANTAADLNTNISSWTAESNIDLSIVFPDLNTISDVDQTQLTHTEQFYDQTNPEMELTSALVATIPASPINAWNTFVTTVTEGGSDLITFTLSDDDGVSYKYWDGGAWSVSSGYAQSNSTADVNTNIPTFPTLTAGLKVKIFFHSDDGTTTPDIDNMVINYDDSIFAVDNPTLDLTAAITATATGEAVIAWNTFASTVTEPGTDDVTFNLSDDDGATWKYWSGAAWVVSSGYAQSNTSADVNTNIVTFPTVAAGLKVRVFLHSNAGDTTPDIDNMVVNYDDFIYSVANPELELTTAIIATIPATALNAFNTFVTVLNEAGSDLITFTLSDDDGVTYKYWSAAWVTSSGYAQSNSSAEINTNIPTFPLTVDGFKIKIFLHSDDASTTPDVDNLVLNYDDAIYAIDNPTVLVNSFDLADSLESFEETTSTKPAGTEIKYTVVFKGQQMYYGGSWVNSNGTYAQSNTAAEIETNKATLDLSTGGSFRINAFLHSDSGDTRPELTTVTYGYNYFISPITPQKTLVGGFILYPDGSANDDASLSFEPVNPYFYDLNSIARVSSVNSTSDGLVEIDIIESETANTSYKMTIDYNLTSPGTEIKEFIVNVPATDVVTIDELTEIEQMVTVTYIEARI